MRENHKHAPSPGGSSRTCCPPSSWPRPRVEHSYSSLPAPCASETPPSLTGPWSACTQTYTEVEMFTWCIILMCSRFTCQYNLYLKGDVKKVRKRKYCGKSADKHQSNLSDSKQSFLPQLWLSMWNVQERLKSLLISEYWDNIYNHSFGKILDSPAKSQGGGWKRKAVNEPKGKTKINMRGRCSCLRHLVLNERNVRREH